jgi:hypothetical protein
MAYCALFLVHISVNLDNRYLDMYQIDTCLGTKKIPGEVPTGHGKRTVRVPTVLEEGSDGIYS